MTRLKYKVTTTAYAVHQEGESPVYAETTTHVLLDDDGDGPFIVLQQTDDNAEAGKVKFDVEELPLIVEAAKKLIPEGVE